jgi:ribose 5-phosphate isomerase B
MAAIAVGADDAGAALKERLAAYLQQRGYQVRDFGNGAGQDYPEVAAEVAEAVARGEHDRALLVCGTGLGMAIAANKVPGGAGGDRP